MIAAVATSVATGDCPSRPYFSGSHERQLGEYVTYVVPPGEYPIQVGTFAGTGTVTLELTCTPAGSRRTTPLRVNTSQCFGSRSVICEPSPTPPPQPRPTPPPSGCDSGTSNVPQIQCGDTVSVNIAGNNDFHPYMLDLRNQRGNTQVLLSTCGSEVEDPDLCFYQEYIDDDQSKFEFASPPTPSSTCARQLDF